MTLTAHHQSDRAPRPDAALRRERQLRDLRFLESFQATLVGCADEAAVFGAATHRVAAAFAVESACLAAYDPVTDTLSIVHQARTKRTWDLTILHQALVEERTVSVGALLVVPVVCEGGACGDPRTVQTRRVWGVLAIVRPATGQETTGHYIPSERQTLRAAGERIGAELERRRISLLDSTLDGLLHKTKPIDVYTHALRELRRFIRYDHSASIITSERGIPQAIVRVEKVVRSRGATDTLVDSTRRAHTLRLTMAQTHYLHNLHEAILLIDEGQGWHLAVGHDDAGAAGLWHVLSLNDKECASERAILCYPLVFGGQMLGLLRLAAKRPHAFERMDQYLNLLDRFARLLSVTLYRSELYHQSDRQLRAIKEMGRAITQPMPVDEICRHVLGIALGVLGVQAGSVGLLTEEGTLQIVAQQGRTRDKPPLLVPGQGITGTVVQTGHSWAVPDVTREPAYVVVSDRVRSELVVPITYDCEVIGFLDVESFEEQRFREEDEEVITFLELLANQTAIAIKTAQLRTQAVERVGAAMSLDPGLTTVGLYERIIDELRATNERLLAVSQAKSEFLANMSHELRTPLNAIIGFSNLLLNPEVASAIDEADRRQSLQDIRASGRHLLALINDILDLSKVEAGKVELAIAPFSAAALFENVQTVAETLGAEGHKALRIEVSLDPAIDTISADEGKFRQIMYNLVSNAVKFTPPGGLVTIKACPLHASTAPPDDLLVTVADTGIGIAPQDHECIFEAFQQIDSSASRQYSGTGLGLALVRQLVDLHGGRVWLESTPGQGSTFSVLLPRALT